MCFYANAILFIITIALYQSLESGSMIPPASFRCCFYSGSFVVHTNFRIVYSILVKNVIGILRRVALNLCIALGSLDILIINTFKCEHRISFYLFVGFFFQFLSLMCYRF